MPIVFTPIDHGHLQQIVYAFNKEHRLKYNNFFGPTVFFSYAVYQSDHCLLIRCKEFHFYRLFVVSDDSEQLILLLSQLSGYEYVINIPTKSGIEPWLIILEKSGFEHYETYSRYYYHVNDKRRPVEDIEFAKPSEKEDISVLLYENFNKYTDHLPSLDELQTMIEQKAILVDHDKNGKVCGVNIFTIKGRTAYGNAWIDKGENAIGLYLASKNIYVDRGVKFSYFWVRDSNTKVAKMHLKSGAKLDGLKDYTFIKRNQNDKQ